MPSLPVVRRVVTWTVGLIALGLLGYWATRPEPVLVDVGTVARGPLRVTLDQEGHTRARQTYVVSAPVGGRLLRIALEPGDPVSAGRTEVARIVPATAPLLDERARTTAEARVRTAEAAVRQAEAALAEARTAAEFAARERDRMERLFEGHAVSARDVEAARAEAQARADAVAGAQAGVEAARQDLAAARAAAATPSRLDAPGGTVAVRAPANGVVLRRLHESETVVAPGEPLLEIADVEHLEVVADYLSTDAVRIRPGMPVVIDRWGGGGTLDGHVRRVEPVGFVKVSALGVEEQRVNVIVDLDDPRAAWEALGAGFRVEARVVLWADASVLVVPAGALFRQGDDWAVFTIDADGVARTRTVTVGQQTGTEAQVLDGLPEGTRVVVHPSDRVGDGVRVAPRG
jgi:HlyD family secretion protein